MASQYVQTVVDTQSKILDAALGRLSLVREAADRSNRVQFEAFKEYIGLAKDDLAAVAAAERPSATDLITRRFEHATQVIAVQDKAFRGIVEAWKPVLDRAAQDATSGVGDAVKAARTGLEDAVKAARSSVEDVVKAARSATTAATPAETPAETPVAQPPAAKAPAAETPAAEAPASETPAAETPAADAPAAKAPAAPKNGRARTRTSKPEA